MSLAALREKILSEATQVVTHVSQANSLAMEEERSRALHELRTMEEGIVTAAKKEAERLARIIHQQANLEAKSLILSAKQEALKATKEAFLAYLVALPKEEKKAVTKALHAFISPDAGEVIPDADGNGFVFRGKGMEVNLTFPYLVDQVFWKYRSEFAQELFG